MVRGPLWRIKVIPGIPRIPGMNSQPMILRETSLKKSASGRSGVMFFQLVEGCLRPFSIF